MVPTRSSCPDTMDTVHVKSLAGHHVMIPWTLCPTKCSYPDAMDMAPTSYCIGLIPLSSTMSSCSDTICMVHHYDHPTLMIEAYGSIPSPLVMTPQISAKYGAGDELIELCLVNGVLHAKDNWLRERRNMCLCEAAMLLIE